MLGLFDVLKDQIRPKYNSIRIDNWVFKLHYRFTTIIFLIATILVTSREFIGEHIRCISNLNLPGAKKVIETFCFFSTTFSLVENLQDAYNRAHIAHRGVAPYAIGSKQPIRRHMYYQWVPFVLFGQAIMFYLTHLLWKKMEDNRIQKLLSGLSYSRFAHNLEKEVEVDNHCIPTKQQRDACIQNIKSLFMQRIALNKSWAVWFTICEILNLAHVILQVYLTNRFLGNEFLDFGFKLVHDGSKTLDTVFPKLTKCIFHKYGYGGSVEIHDALCVMALNIINEKVYAFLWFWFFILFSASASILIWRFFTILCYKRCMSLNQIIFGHAISGKLYPWHLKMVIKHCNYLDWLLLKYLSKNMNRLAFRELFINISEELEENKPLFMLSSDKTGFNVGKFD